MAELRHGVIGAEAHVERTCNSEEDAVERSRFRQVAEPDAAAPVAEPGPRVADDESRLSGAAGPEQGDEAAAAVEPARDRTQVAGAPDKRVTLRRQAAGHLAQRPPRAVGADHAVGLVGVAWRHEARG